MSNALTQVKELVPANSDAPFVLSPTQVNEVIPANDDSQLLIGGRWGYAKKGQTCMATDGLRVVLWAGHLGVFYVLVNELSPCNGISYFQTPKGFIDEVKTFPFIDAARRATPIAKLAEYEMQFLMGVCSCVSSVGFVTVMGTDALKFVLKNKDNFARWSKAVSVCFRVRDILKEHTPTLYEKILDLVLLSAWGGLKSIGGNLPEAMATDPMISARGAGVLVGKLGKKVMAQRLSALSVIWTILWTVLTKVASSIPGALKLTVSDQQQNAEQIVAALGSIGVPISDKEARKIIEEIMRNANTERVRDALRMLNESFEPFKLTVGN